MTFEELVEEIQNAGLYPVRVESISDDEANLSFVGTLSEYFQAVKAIRSTVVFISTNALDEGLLSYHNVIADEEEDQEDEYRGEEEEVDLCLIEPGLAAFKEKVGMVGSFEFSVPVASTNLKFEIMEAWWGEFLQLWGQARQTVEDQRSAEIQELEAVEEKNAKVILTRLQELIGDKQFVCLRTQRAMREYALERIPELKEFDEQVVKAEIQDIAAKIDARGLSRK